MFLIVTATGTAYTGSRRQNVSHPRVTVEDFMPMPRWFPSPPSLAFHRHEGAWLDAASQLNASGIADTERMWRTEERCRLLVLRSCPEVEQPRVFPLLQELYRKPVLPAGLLLPEDSLRESDGDHGAGAGVGPRNATRGGVNGSLRKLSRSKTSAHNSRVHPNPRVLGDVQSSYKGVTLTQNKPRNQSDQVRKQFHESSARTKQGIYHRLIRRTRLNDVGSTGDTEPAANNQ
ncbi:putative UDP-rhamnose:rhamnosyltransferase 1 [Panicum virgatum]|uniref:putative UDP-rhamnose:rhamnosyltransferase 1 n=1 Tax=Panicum virgatum TaxID=38727 RepID=UPI0019D524A5|nr:putative UDP-rhamnose:rhamnosyltransferase 1 [Panicum virgatum]